MNNRLRMLIFISCIYILLVSGIVGQVIIRNETLQGETVKEANIEMSLHNVWNGEWQSDFENYLRENLKAKEWLIPIRNQIMYSVLKTSPNSNIVIGKNNNLYEEEYICFETQIYQPMSKDEIDILIEKLDVLNNRLKDNGKQLFIFITPSKAEIYPEDIPEKYLKTAPETKVTSTYDLFMNSLAQTDIAYYDSTADVRALKQVAEFHVFPKTGTHWSRVTAMMCAEKLSDSMEAQLNIDLPECRVQYKKCELPIHPDSDIYDLLNLMKNSDETFYEPIIEITDINKNDYTILARGGSFMGSSLRTLISNNFFKDSYYLENTIAICPEGMYSGKFDTYDLLPISDMIKNSDIIFLEVNEEAIPRMSFGFIDYILENKIV